MRSLPPWDRVSDSGRLLVVSWLRLERLALSVQKVAFQAADTQQRNKGCFLPFPLKLFSGGFCYRNLLCVLVTAPFQPQMGTEVLLPGAVSCLSH